MDFLYGIVSGTVKAVGIVILGVAYLTKPDNDSLKKQIEGDVQDAVHEHTQKNSSGFWGTVSTLGINVAAKVVTKTALGTSSYIFKDLLFLKYANVTLLTGDNQKFIGAFQTWFPLKINQPHN